MDYEKIGIFILNLRKEKNMTQQELADKLHVTDKAVSKWETGRGMPDIATIKNLGKLFNVTEKE
jgi:transcriptional regulator with XRE-family HTH domain